MCFAARAEQLNNCITQATGDPTFLYENTSAPNVSTKPVVVAYVDNGIHAECCRNTLLMDKQSVVNYLNIPGLTTNNETDDAFVTVAVGVITVPNPSV